MAWPPPTPPVPPKKPLPGALLQAVQDNDINAVKRLLLENADVNERDSTGNTALSRAAAYGHVEIARLLIDKDANIDSRNVRGDTALMLIISSYYHNKEPMVRLLLNKGANIDIRNNDGDTAMSLAVQKQRPQVIDMLKETAATRKRLAEEFARAAEAKRRAELAAKQARLKEKAKDRPRPGPKPPKAA